MTNAPSTGPGGDTPSKDPQDWATGDEPATAPQLSYLQTLAHDTGADVPEDLTKAQASELIDRLRQESPRVGDEGGSGS
jgi:hypothetical protein